MKRTRIYFDNAATTPLDPEVLGVMMTTLEHQFGNPSSIHADGRQARMLVESARKQIANFLNASIGEVFFTSSGTESNNMILKNAVRDLGVQRIISSPLEHHCVAHSLKSLEMDGLCRVEMTEVDAQGNILLEKLEEKLADTGGGAHVGLVDARQQRNWDDAAHQCRRCVVPTLRRVFS